MADKPLQQLRTLKDKIETVRQECAHSKSMIEDAPGFTPSHGVTDGDNTGSDAGRPLPNLPASLTSRFAVIHAQKVSLQKQLQKPCCRYFALSTRYPLHPYTTVQFILRYLPSNPHGLETTNALLHRSLDHVDILFGELQRATAITEGVFDQKLATLSGFVDRAINKLSSEYYTRLMHFMSDVENVFKRAKPTMPLTVERTLECLQRTIAYNEYNANIVLMFASDIGIAAGRQRVLAEFFAHPPINYANVVEELGWKHARAAVAVNAIIPHLVVSPELPADQRLITDFFERVEVMSKDEEAGSGQDMIVD